MLVCHKFDDSFDGFMLWRYAISIENVQKYVEEVTLYAYMDIQNNKRDWKVSLFEEDEDIFFTPEI